MLRKKKAAYFQKTYDPIKAAIVRKGRSKEHTEYYRNRKANDPKFRKNLSRYYRDNLAKKEYGEFWECAILIMKIKRKVIKLVPTIYERMKMRGIVKRIIMRSALKRSLLYGWKFNYTEMP